MKVEESLNVTFKESPPPPKLSPLVDDDIGEKEAIERKVKEVNNVENEPIEVDEAVKKESSDEECSTSGSEDEEYAMVVRDFKKLFNRRGSFLFFSSIAVQTFGSGISNLLAVATTFTGSGNLYCQWKLYPGSGNALCILFPTLTKKDKDKQVLLAEDQAWMESSSDSDQEINANMVFMAQIEKVLSDSEASSSFADEQISENNTSSGGGPQITDGGPYLSKKTDGVPQKA
nr:transposase, Ptta/En/Spm, transposase, Tnp1/En/Spm-like protein [Tanacetum cinerariifolium]